MTFDLKEAVEYYRKQGAPGDQSALVQLLKELQLASGGSISMDSLSKIAAAYGISLSFLQAVVRRIPSLRIAGSHLLEICSGPNCGKHAALAVWAEQQSRQGLTIQFVPCMRQCGKGPNIRLDGKLYHSATVAFLEALVRDL